MEENKVPMKEIVVKLSYGGKDLDITTILNVLQAGLDESVVYFVQSTMPEGAKWKNVSDFLKENPNYHFVKGV